MNQASKLLAEMALLAAQRGDWSEALQCLECALQHPMPAPMWAAIQRARLATLKSKPWVKHSS